ncbi:hypothetical protein D3C72_2248280 [compost metagenome]
MGFDQLTDQRQANPQALPSMTGQLWGSLAEEVENVLQAAGLQADAAIDHLQL